MDTEQDELDAGLERRLGEELRSQLDRQLGRAAPYFLRRYAADNEVLAVRRRGRLRRLAIAATAAAFCAGVFAWQRLPLWQRPDEPPPELAVAAPLATVAQSRQTVEQPLAPHKVDQEQQLAADETVPEQTSSLPSDPESAGDGGRRGAAEPLILGHTLKTRTFDEGTLLVGRTPVRKVRRQWLERVEWFDPHNGAHVQRIVPHEDVVFVPLPIN